MRLAGRSSSLDEMTAPHPGDKNGDRVEPDNSGSEYPTKEGRATVSMRSIMGLRLHQETGRPSEAGAHQPAHGRPARSVGKNRVKPRQVQRREGLPELVPSGSGWGSSRPEVGRSLSLYIYCSRDMCQV